MSASLHTSDGGPACVRPASRASGCFSTFPDSRWEHSVCSGSAGASRCENYHPFHRCTLGSSGISAAHSSHEDAAFRRCWSWGPSPCRGQSPRSQSGGCTAQHPHRPQHPSPSIHVQPLSASSALLSSLLPCLSAQKQAETISMQLQPHRRVRMSAGARNHRPESA